MIHVKALGIARHIRILLAELKASRRRGAQFMNRNKLCIRHRTAICQRLPTEYKQKPAGEVLSPREHSSGGNTAVCQIGNADQTPVWFNAPENTMVDFKGTRSLCAHNWRRTTKMHCNVVHYGVWQEGFAICCHQEEDTPEREDLSRNYCTCSREGLDV